MLKFDVYKQPFRLLLPDGKNEYRTFAGSVLSLFTILVVIFYGGFKLQILMGRDAYKVQVQDKDLVFSDTEKFGSDMGFNVAAAISGVDEVPPEIGAIKFYKKSWTPTEWITWKEIETRRCSLNDFDYEEEDNTNATFFRTIATVNYL